MDTITNDNQQTADNQTCRQSLDTDTAPRPEWIRGQCPRCGDALVSNCYYVGGRGYLIVWECWSALSEKPTCTYRRVL